MTDTIKTIEKLVGDFSDPILNCRWHETAVTIRVDVQANTAQVRVVLPYHAGALASDWSLQLSRQIESAKLAGAAEVSIKSEVQAHATMLENRIPGVKNIIAVASGKGGVGKSTTAVNLALALVADGARVGVLDADVYGPSVPILIGAASARPLSDDGKRIQPIVRFGLQTMSIGYLVEPEQAVIWRGPMASGALQQLLHDCAWDELDYLIIDLPPGTGDVQLTMAQKIPVTAAIIVTTPQDLALADARKAVAMFDKVNIPVLGIVENMAMHICSQCGHEEAIFGRDGGERLAQESSTLLLGRLPLDIRIREQSDAGKPTVVADQDAAEQSVRNAYLALGRRVAAALVTQTRALQQQPIAIQISDD